MKRRRKYNTRRISLKLSYSVQEIAELFNIHKHAVLIWIRSGLKIIDQKKPYLINGTDLTEFLNNRQKKRKHKCKQHEFFCFKCRLPRSSLPDHIRITTRNQHRLKISGKCEVCQTSIFKEGSVKKLTEFQKIFSVSVQTREHIFGCNDPCVNNDINEGEKSETIQL